MPALRAFSDAPIIVPKIHIYRTEREEDFRWKNWASDYGMLYTLTVHTISPFSTFAALLFDVILIFFVVGYVVNRITVLALVALHRKLIG